ncbi:MAG: hypothetical protein A6D91_09180 [Bacillaceae bacterium G1]|nr:hypothetical protein [Bacillota bacterium]OJF16691.1 MAG: hypothetical protein A6D91_09180 [Bacillaceae bacterium G1]
MERMLPEEQVFGGEPTVTGEGETQKTVRYAGFWLRFLAAVIDVIVLWSVSALSLDWIRKAQGIDPLEFSWVDAVEIAVGMVYYVVLTVVYGQTLGKMIVGIRVVPRHGGKNRWGAILLRESIGKLLSTLLLMIGYLMVAFDKEKRALHDRMASTVVVKVR